MEEALALRLRTVSAPECSCHPSENGVYHTKVVPTIPILDYIRRHTFNVPSMTTSSVVLAAVNIDRWHISGKPSAGKICPKSVHLLTAVALHTSDKFLADPPDCRFSYRASVSGTSAARLLSVEKDFLDRIGWQPACSEKVFDVYMQSLFRTELQGKPLPPNTKKK